MRDQDRSQLLSTAVDLGMLVVAGYLSFKVLAKLDGLPSRPDGHTGSKAKSTSEKARALVSKLKAKGVKDGMRLELTEHELSLIHI